MFPFSHPIPPKPHLIMCSPTVLSNENQRPQNSHRNRHRPRSLRNHHHLLQFRLQHWRREEFHKRFRFRHKCRKCGSNWLNWWKGRERKLDDRRREGGCHEYGMSVQVTGGAQALLAQGGGFVTVVWMGVVFAVFM